MLILTHRRMRFTARSVSHLRMNTANARVLRSNFVPYAIRVRI